VDAAHAFVVPAFGRAQWLAQCLESLQQQTVRSRILIATSTPNDHIAGVAGRSGIEVRVNPAPPGIATDWNFALTLAHAPWVTLAHQDDWYAPTYTEQCLTAAAESPAPLMVFSSALERGSDGAERRHPRVKRMLCEMAFLGQSAIGSRFRKRLLLSFGDPIPCPTVMLHRASLPDFTFPSGFDAALDWAAWLHLAGRAGDFVYVREPLVHRRLHVASATHVHLASRVEEDERILRSLWPGPIAGLIGRVYAAGRRRYESGSH
jgi:glycosyltransferase involved in cell wall biosynthesis